MKLTGIFGTGVSWEQKTLYIPGILPFIVMSVLALLVFKAGFKKSVGVFKESYNRIKLPCIALYGALTLVNLLMLGGSSSCAMRLGNACATLAGKSWIFFAPFLGALGAFFAGSNTVSNLTFAGIQFSIAKTIGVDPAIIVALQSVGGAMGHMVCLHNIVTVCSILGISAALEGQILRKTFLPMMLYGVVAVAGALIIMALHI